MSKKIRADLILLIITIVWGVSFPLMKIVLEFIPAYSYLTLRFLLAAAILAVLFHKSLRKINKRTLLYGFIIGVFMLAGSALQVIGLYSTSASNSGFITGLNVVMVPVFAAIMLKKWPDRASLIGITVAFIGLFFLSGGLNFNFNEGDLLTFLSAICWAFQIIFIYKFTQKEDVFLLTIIPLAVVGVGSSVLWLISDAGKPMVFNGTVIGIVLITAVLCSAFGFGGQTFAQKDTTPAHAALIFTAEPVFAAIFAMLIPNTRGETEILTLIEIIGCLLILSGMLVSELKIGKKEGKAGDQPN